MDNNFLFCVKEKESIKQKIAHLRIYNDSAEFYSLCDRKKLMYVKLLNSMISQLDIVTSLGNLLADDDLGELDASKACKLEGGACESCQ